jgi:hemolysin activation/secretion protein
MVALAAAPAPVWSQAPEAFRPNAGTILNIYAPPTFGPVLPDTVLPKSDDTMRAADAAGSSDAMVRVSGFELEGVSLLPVADIEAALAGLVGQQASLEDLRKAAVRVTGLYRDRGYFLARAYLPAQEIEGGIVRIAVLEGRYDSIEASGSERLDSERLEKTLDAQGVVAGEPIEQDALERSLILLEQQAGAPANAVLQPGTTVGSSNLQVNAPSGPLFSSSLGVDNFANQYTGQSRTTASLQLNSPRGIGDLGTVWFAYSTGASALFASYQAPVGYEGLTLGASFSHYNYELCCEFAALDRSGDATVGGVQARYPLLLNQRALLYASLGFDRKRLTDTWAEGDLDDKEIRVAVFSLDGIAAAHGGQVRYRAAITTGNLKIIGPSDLIGLDAATIDTAGGYSKLSGELEILHPVTSRSFLNLRLSGQIPNRNLDSSEKFLLGGYNGVRAYPEGEAAGDQAWLARLDWVLPLSFAAIPGRAAVRSFVDNGEVWLVHSKRGGLADPGIQNQYSLAGAGLGFNWNLPRGLSLSAYVATQIGDNPGRSFAGNDADGENKNTRGWVGAEWAF